MFSEITCFQSSAGQGNYPSSVTILGSSSAYARLQELYSNSKQWKQGYRASPTSACSPTRVGAPSSKSSKAANLCAASANNKDPDKYAQLLLATSPHVYSSADVQQTGGLQLVAPAGSQDPCQTCTAFVVTSAGETAMAAALGKNVSQCSISVQALYFCATPISRSCSTGWNLPDALTELQQRGRTLPTAACLPYMPDFRPEAADSSRLCTDSCAAPNQFAQQGGFSFVRISNAWEAQSHTRRYGAVLTRFNVFQGFEAFFRNASNSKAVYQEPANAVLLENHAVLLVGYNNNQQYWVAKNSWGLDWGDKGLFRVAYDNCSVLTPGSEAYGVIWKPKVVPDAVKLPVRPAADPQHPGCYWYKARPGDYLSRAAVLAGIPLEHFMLNNTATVKDLDAPITGLNLLLCKPQPGNILDATKPVDRQLQSLLQIKAAIDTTGVLKEWNEQSGANGGYCKRWTGVKCSGDGSNIVTGLDLWQGGGAAGLQGMLPAVDAFDGLPALQLLCIADQPGITGAVPSDWSRLQQLEKLQVVQLFNNSLAGTLPPTLAQLKWLKSLYLWGNKLSGPLPGAWSTMQAMENLQLSFNSPPGTLPPQWSAMQSLRVLYLHKNTLSGPLPSAWSSMPAMEDLRLSFNSLTGTLPPQWSVMQSLRVLYLHRNTLSGPLPSTWSSMQAMEDLELHVNSLTGTLPPQWSTMRSLRVLYLHHNKLSGPLPSAWSSMQAMEDLELSTNSLAGTLPPQWSTMRSIKVLYLAFNNVSGNVPASWQAMKQLQDVYLEHNPKLGSCLPTSWKQQLSGFDFQQWVYAGTNITGFCH